MVGPALAMSTLAQPHCGPQIGARLPGLWTADVFSPYSPVATLTPPAGHAVSCSWNGSISGDAEETHSGFECVFL